MTKSILAGRRIHIAGSISPDPKIASPEEVDLARSFVSRLVAKLIRKGASFVIPVDAEKLRDGDTKPRRAKVLGWSNSLGYRQGFQVDSIRRHTGNDNSDRCCRICDQHHSSRHSDRANKNGSGKSGD
jgi:hypothetical protein